MSFATINRIDLFTRQIYFNILTKRVDYCRKEKGMELYAYSFMPSHIHLIFRSAQEDPSGLIRDFKKYSEEINRNYREQPSRA